MCVDLDTIWFDSLFIHDYCSFNYNRILKVMLHLHTLCSSGAWQISCWPAWGARCRWPLLRCMSSRGCSTSAASMTCVTTPKPGIDGAQRGSIRSQSSVKMVWYAFFLVSGRILKLNFYLHLDNIDIIKKINMLRLKLTLKKTYNRTKKNHLASSCPGYLRDLDITNFADCWTYVFVYVYFCQRFLSWDCIEW